MKSGAGRERRLRSARCAPPRRPRIAKNLRARWSCWGLLISGWRRGTFRRTGKTGGRNPVERGGKGSGLAVAAGLRDDDVGKFGVAGILGSGGVSSKVTLGGKAAVDGSGNSRGDRTTDGFVDGSEHHYNDKLVIAAVV